MIRVIHLNQLKRICNAAIVAGALAGCVTHAPPFNPQVGNPEFRQWCRSALDGDNGTNKAVFRDAYRGDSKSTGAFFQMALDYQMDGIISPADEMWLTWIFKTLLYRQGDARFAEILGEHSPQTQAAVRTFLSISQIGDRFPQTSLILQSAPDIDFPLEQAYRQSGA